MNLHKRLMSASMVLIAVSLTITAVIFTLLINRQFDRYLVESHNSNIDRMTAEMTDLLYGKTTRTFEEISMFAVSEGYYLEVIDEEGTMLYSTQNLNGPGMMGMRGSILQMKNMPMFNGIEVRSTVVTVGDGQEYLINVGYEAPDGLSEDAARFKNTIYYAVILALFLSLLTGFLLSRKFAAPISKEIGDVADAAKEIASGNMTVALSKKASIAEISDLNDSVTRMAGILADQEMLRRDLVDTVSHEVKTPLTVLKSQIDAFLDGIFDPDTRKLEKCKDEIVRLEGLIERMEDYDSFTTKQYVLNLSTFSVKAELEAMKQILTPQFEKKGMTIQIDASDDVDTVSDRYKFRQILYNFLSNAYKFSDENTAVVIQLQSDANQFTVLVENKGIAIEPSDASKIFDPRFRSENADTMDPHGRGLGLGIARSLAEFLGGQVVLVESSMDKTVFSIELPIKVAFS